MYYVLDDDDDGDCDLGIGGTVDDVVIMVVMMVLTIVMTILTFQDGEAKVSV